MPFFYTYYAITHITYCCHTHITFSPYYYCCCHITYMLPYCFSPYYYRFIYILRHIRCCFRYYYTCCCHIHAIHTLYMPHTYSILFSPHCCFTLLPYILVVFHATYIHMILHAPSSLTYAIYCFSSHIACYITCFIGHAIAMLLLL